MSCDTKNVNKFQIFLGMYNYREKLWEKFYFVSYSFENPWKRVYIKCKFSNTPFFRFFSIEINSKYVDPLSQLYSCLEMISIQEHSEEGVFSAFALEK